MLSLAMLCGVVVCGGCGCGCFASAVVHSVKGVSGAQLQNKTKKKKKKKRTKRGKIENGRKRKGLSYEVSKASLRLHTNTVDA